MFDERIFKETEEKGFCFIENATNKDETYLLVKIDRNNKRVSSVGDRFIIVDVEGD